MRHLLRSLPQRLIGALLVIATGTGTSSVCAADAKFPTGPIRMIVGTPPGGTTDVVARLMAAKISQSLGQTVVVENRSGASGLMAAEGVAAAPADGYTLLMASSQLATYRALYPATRLKPEDLEPLGLIATSPYVMVVHPTLPVTTYGELMAYAKAHPGTISYAGSAPGTAQHLGWELIKRKGGVEMEYVPYKGTSALMGDLLAGRLQAGIDNVAVLTPYIKNGQLRGIAVTGLTRSSLLPEVPTIDASGYPGFQAMGWFGLFATGQVPAATAAALRNAVKLAMEAPDIRDKLTSMGAEPKTGSPAELCDLLNRETTVWSKVIKDSGITPQ
jgi:tripartite-type tricarboxylate transporter receptor subunit TctC